MDKKYNIVVIGGSGMGRRHMNSVNLNEHAVLYGACDKDPETLKICVEKRAPLHTTTDWHDFVNDPNVDAAIIVVPDKYHLEMTEAFLRAGKDVLCEKPMALHLDECEKMIRAERESGRRLMIGQVCRYAPAFIEAKKIVESGRIGELFFVESEYAHSYEKARGVDDWRVTPDRHAFIGGACHAVDLLRWIAGDPTEVSAYSNHKCLTDWPVDDCTVAIFKFPNNVIGKVFCSIGCSREYTMRSVFYGTKGTIICDNRSDTMQLFSRTEPHEDGTVDFTKAHILPVTIAHHNTFGEIEEFLESLSAARAPKVTSLEGANTVAVCTATVRAAQSGKPEQIEYLKID